ncbi:MAG: ribonuclease HIII [Planctomycetes bacterium]|nr:ribonuclease HIII [Planctomycetota bacterium]NUQ33983.1 ribonuclease HIII [Planctomycetaceae bacterium]
MPPLPDSEFQTLLARVREALLDDGWTVDEQRPIDYGVALRLAGGGMLNVYNGKAGPKAVVAGKFGSDERKRLEALASTLVEVAASTAPGEQAGAATNLYQSKEPWIGCDESGKGDYFGPLVVAAVLVSPKQVDELGKAGVRDSKRVSDARAMQLSAWIEEHCETALRVLMPPEYNARYGGNLNEMLASLHAETIAELAIKHKAKRAISDQFGNPAKLREFLIERKAKVELISIPKAEADMAVAAASIVARGRFLAGLKELSSDATIELPPGAGPQVDSAARELAGLYGAGCLKDYAKLHFKTTQKVAPK